MRRARLTAIIACPGLNRWRRLSHAARVLGKNLRSSPSELFSNSGVPYLAAIRTQFEMSWKEASRWREARMLAGEREEFAEPTKHEARTRIETAGTN